MGRTVPPPPPPPETDTARPRRPDTAEPPLFTRGQLASFLTGLALYVLAGGLTGRLVWSTLCGRDFMNQHHRRDVGLFAGLLWPGALPVYAIAKAVPCRGFEFEPGYLERQAAKTPEKQGTQ